MKKAFAIIKKMHENITKQLETKNLLFEDIVILLDEDGLETEVLMDNFSEELLPNFKGFSLALKGENHLVLGIPILFSAEEISLKEVQQATLEYLKTLDLKEYQENHFVLESEIQKEHNLKKLEEDRGYLEENIKNLSIQE